MIWMGLLLCLVSCKDAMETIGLGGDEIPAEGVTLNIELPNFSEKKINTRAGADESISKVTAVFYGESNTYKGMANVNIDGSKNAGYLAAEIIALSDESLAEKIAEDRKKQSEAVLKKDAGIQEKIKEL